MNEDDYPVFVERGIESLKTKYGYLKLPAPEMPLLITTGEKVDIEFTDGRIHSINVVTPEFCDYIEKSLIKFCAPYVNHIEKMNEDEINGFTFAFLMVFDIQRGMGLGQIPQLKFYYSEEFIAWEKNIWNRINEREKELGME
jgi:hypothetical protein